MDNLEKTPLKDNLIILFWLMVTVFVVMYLFIEVGIPRELEMRADRAMGEYSATEALNPVNKE